MRLLTAMTKGQQLPGLDRAHAVCSSWKNDEVRILVSLFQRLESCGLAQEHNKLRDHVVLDSASTVDLFCNQRLVMDIRTMNTILCLRTNWGEDQ